MLLDLLLALLVTRLLLFSLTHKSDPFTTLLTILEGFPVVSKIKSKAVSITFKPLYDLALSTKNSDAMLSSEI